MSSNLSTGPRAASPDADSVGADRTTDRPTISASSRTWPAFWAPFVVITTIVVTSQRSLFHVRLSAWGDAAVNSLSILRAEHLQQLVGNYSRVGFHHPGPAFMYLLGAGEVVFFRVLHLVPAPYNGQLLAAGVYVAGMASLVCLAVYRWTRSVPATVLTCGIVFAFAARTPLFGQDWFPYLYVSAFLLFVVAGAAVAAGRTVELPSFVLACCLLIHGHVSFLLFTGVTFVMVVVSWWSSHRGKVRHELAAHRLAGLVSIAVVALAALPMVLDVVLHFPGEWPAYATFALHGDHAPRTTGQVLRFFAWSWTHADLPWPSYVVALVVGAVLLATERDRRRRRALLTVYAMLALQTVLYLYYVARGVDFLAPLATYSYVGFFYRVVPVTLLLAVVTHACLRLTQDGHRVRRWEPTAVASAISVAIGVLVLTSGHLALPVTSAHGYGRLTTRLTHLDGGPSRPVVLADPSGTTWPTVAGIGLALSRRGTDWCTTGPAALPVMFGRNHVCTAAEVRTGLQVTLTDQLVPAGGRRLWLDRPDDPRTGDGRVRAYLTGG